MSLPVDPIGFFRNDTDRFNEAVSDVVFERSTDSSSEGRDNDVLFIWRSLYDAISTNALRGQFYTEVFYVSLLRIYRDRTKLFGVTDSLQCLQRKSIGGTNRKYLFVDLFRLTDIIIQRAKGRKIRQPNSGPSGSTAAARFGP
jgi:hypothetical protein